MRKLIFGLFIFFSLYTFFWIKIFHVYPSAKNKTIVNGNVPVQSKISSENKNNLSFSAGASAVLSATNILPKSYKISLMPRRQFFNLSCEFASATVIISNLANDPFFASSNEEAAEKKLIEQVGISQNPNIGIRMGDILQGDFTTLYDNLNKKFGGADYYGVHAPPFIDLFAKYGLIAKPILNDGETVSRIKQAIYSGHLIMTWIKIGYGQAVDVALSYGQVPVIKGEHVVVISGYDENGVFVMDPAIGVERHILYQDIIAATSSFPLPFLEVYSSSVALATSASNKEVLPDNIAGLTRGNFSIVVENGSGQFGAGDQMSNILKDFGYHILGVQNADNSNYQNVSIIMKKSMLDYSGLLKRDLWLSSYAIATISANLSEDSTESAVIIVGN